MPYVRVPRDLTNFKEKFAFGLTSRQLACAIGAAVVVVPAYYYIRQFNVDLATYAAIVLASPFVALTFVKKNGLPLEKFIGSLIRSRILCPPIRKYQTETLYQRLADQNFQSLIVQESEGGQSAENERPKRKYFARRKKQ